MCQFRIFERLQKKSDWIKTYQMTYQNIRLIEIYLMSGESFFSDVFKKCYAEMCEKCANVTQSTTDNTYVTVTFDTVTQITRERCHSTQLIEAS